MKATKTRGPAADAARDPISEALRAGTDLAGVVIAVIRKYGHETAALGLQSVASELASDGRKIQAQIEQRAEQTPQFTIGDELRRIRKARQWTLKEMAARMGIHVSTYRSWEHGISQPSAASLNEGLFKIREHIALGARRLRED